MKQADIKPGLAYYYDRSTNWRESWRGQKAVRVDDKRYRISTKTWRLSHDPKWWQDANGAAVLVDLYGDDGQVAEREAVPAAHLRGPWEQIKAEVDARREAAHSASERAVREREAKQRVGGAAYTRASALGFKPHLGYGPELGGVWLPAADLQRLLDAYEAAQIAGEDGG